MDTVIAIERVITVRFIKASEGNGVALEAPKGDILLSDVQASPYLVSSHVSERCETRFHSPSGELKDLEHPPHSPLLPIDHRRRMDRQCGNDHRKETPEVSKLQV